jgi:cytochrome c-type biogenesis protein CcmE
MKTRHKRITFIVFGLAGLSIAAFLVASAFKNNLVFFFSPSQVAAREAPVGKKFRIGGLVEKGSIKTEADGLTIKFSVTDTANSIPVVFKGIPPTLFMEGKGCVAQGQVSSDGVFYADEIFAKHDENYRAPEVTQSIDKAKATQEAKEAARTIKE